MNCLLLGGAPNVGKTETITHIVNEYLIKSKKFTVDTSKPHQNLDPDHLPDYMWILSRKNQEGKKITIIINSAADNQKTIKAFKTFMSQNMTKFGPYHILISPIRDIDTPNNIRSFFLSNIITSKYFQLEIPFAKITRKKKKGEEKTKKGKLNETALKWYREQMDKLVRHTLENIPFNI